MTLKNVVQLVLDPFLAAPANSFVEPVNNNLVEDDEDKPFNIFEYIGRPTAEREVRRKVNGEMKKMGKVDALRILMTIAGDTWEQDLVMGSKDDGSASGGHAGQIWAIFMTKIHYFLEQKVREKVLCI